MLNWIACELHTHTRNSDGSFTVEELCHAAKQYGIECIALTDHNTAAGCANLTPELAAQTVEAIKGIEWTTFFGHMVVLGAHKYVDWRFATVENIDEKLREVKAAGGLAGIAHPYRVGSPLCTGCHWEYDVHAWELVDYLEIWSGLMPSTQPSNIRAIELWNALLDKGYHIAATYGKDWHGPDHSGRPDACTYLGLDTPALSADAALRALNNGRSYVSMAPTISLTAAQNDQTFTLGDTAGRDFTSFTIEIGMQSRKEIWGRHTVELEQIRLLGNGAVVLAEAPLHMQDRQTIQLDMDTTRLTWLRAEVLGRINGAACTLAITSPLYIG